MTASNRSYDEEGMSEKRCENSCDEGWFKDPSSSNLFRRTYPYGDPHKLVMLTPQSNEDKQFYAKKHIFDGNPGLCGFFFWASNDPAQPQLSATIFPLTPSLQGKCLWATTRHSGSLTPAIGSVGSVSQTYELAIAGQHFPLEIVFTNAPARTIYCPSTNESMNGLKGGDWSPDFAILRSDGPAGVPHFWIPDPTPLTPGHAIALFGNPGSSPTLKSLEVGATFANLFTYSYKSVSTGVTTNVSQSIVCHDASTMGGFCGSVGISIDNCVGNNFSFIHCGNHDIPMKEQLVGPPSSKLHNHGLSVNDPDFKAAYEKYVVPFLKDAQQANVLSQAHIAAIVKYVPSF